MDKITALKEHSDRVALDIRQRVKPVLAKLKAMEEDKHPLTAFTASTIAISSLELAANAFVILHGLNPEGAKAAHGILSKMVSEMPAMAEQAAAAIKAKQEGHHHSPGCPCHPDNIKQN